MLERTKLAGVETWLRKRKKEERKLLQFLSEASAFLNETEAEYGQDLVSRTQQVQGASLIDRNINTSTHKKMSQIY